jgi:hypothetical protein
MAETSSPPVDPGRPPGPLAAARSLHEFIAEVLALASAFGTAYSLIEQRKTILLVFSLTGVAISVGLYIAARWYRRRQPQPLAPAVGRPGERAYLRGPLPFDQGESLLGRKRDVDLLLARILSSEFRFGYLTGEAGVGKTSLLRARVVSEAAQAGLCVIYVSHLGPDAVLAVSNAARQHLIDSPDLLSNASLRAVLATIPRSPGQRILVICDQSEEYFLEQRASRDQDPFARAVIECLEDSDLSASFLFSIKKDFVADLERFQGPVIPQPLDTRFSFTLKNWQPEVARKVLEDAARLDGVPFAAALQQAIVEDLAAGSGDVRPVELQIVASSLAERGIHGLEGYHQAEKAQGVLRTFIRGIIDPAYRKTTDMERQVARHLLRALCSDQAEARVAVGLTDRELVNYIRSKLIYAGLGNLISNQLLERQCSAVLLRCLSSYLITLGDQQRYNLSNDYLVRPIMAATADEEPKHERANRVLERYLQVHDSTVALRLGDFFLIETHMSKERRSDPATKALVGRTRRHFALRAAEIIFALFFVALCLWVVDTLRWQDQLERWGLPRDLYRRQRMLHALALNDEVTQTAWIANSIKRLDLRGSRITTLESLPRYLEVLDISDLPVRILSGIPDSLDSLALGSNTRLLSLHGIPHDLSNLSLGTLGTSNLEGLPRGLKRLDISDTQFASVKSLSPLSELEALTLNGTQVDNLKGLPEKKLKELRLLNNPRLRVREYLPPKLETLELENVDKDYMPPVADLPRSLKHLALRSVRVANLADLPSLESLTISLKTPEQMVDPGGLEHLPKSLDALTLLGPTGLPLATPPHLDSYEVDLDNNELDRYTKLKAQGREPPTAKQALDTLLRKRQDLSRLQVTFSRLDGLPVLPPSLRVLVLDGTDLPHIEGLPRLDNLRIREDHSLRVIAALPESLVTLDLAGVDRLERIEKLPQQLRCLNLHGTSLARLPKLPVSLRALDITGTNFILSGMPADVLPPHLLFLAVDPSSVKNLRNVPDSVRELDFRPQDDLCEREEESYRRAAQGMQE